MTNPSKSNMSLVRLAVPSDEDAIMALLMEMHAEESVEPVDEFKVRMILRRMLHMDGGVVGIIRTRDDIEATIGLTLDEAWYSSAPYINKLWLFVPTSYRKTPHAKSALEFSRWYSDQVGIPLMSSEVCSEATVARVNLVSRQMPELGRLFVYNRRIMAETPVVAVS